MTQAEFIIILAVIGSAFAIIVLALAFLFFEVLKLKRSKLNDDHRIKRINYVVGIRNND